MAPTCLFIPWTILVTHTTTFIRTCSLMEGTHILLLALSEEVHLEERLQNQIPLSTTHCLPSETRGLQVFKT